MYKYFRAYIAWYAGVLWMAEIAAYIRVSTEQQRDDGSHISQRERIAEWADHQEYDAGDWDSYHVDKDDWQPIDGQVTGDIRWFEDIAISGQSDDRDAYTELMDGYQEFEFVVVREISRFGRAPLTVLQHIEEIVDSETQFTSITEDFDTSSAIGRAFVRVVAVINGMYSDLRREQAIRAAERRKEQGLAVGRPKKLSDPLIQEALDLRQKGVSYSAVARIMEDKPDGPEEISGETIRRYCKGVEADD